MASAFGTNTPNYSSSDFTNNRRMLTNYNYVKKIVNDSKNKNSYCLNSANGNVILKPVALRCNPNPLTDNSKLHINETGNLAGSCKKLGYVRSYELLSDITKGFYSPLCYRKSQNIDGISKPKNIYTDAQSICCDINGPEEPNIDGDMQFGLYYTEFDLGKEDGKGQKLVENLTDPSSPKYNQLKWNTDNPPDVNGIKDGTGEYIIDPDFLLFSTKECCNNYVQQLNKKIINVVSQFDSDNPNQWVYGSKANPDLFKINYNSPVYFKANGIDGSCN